jgi:hypothetical protein
MTDERHEALVGAVKACRSRAVLEELFGFYKISDDSDAKIDILIEAMDKPKVGYCGESTKEDRYETLLGIYLSGLWQEGCEKKVMAGSL